MSNAYLMNPTGTVAAEVTTGGALRVDGSATTQPVSISGTMPVSGTVAIGNLPATQPVSGSVSVSNLPATQPVSGSVSVSNFPATQPISGSVSVSNFPATQPVSGTVTATGPLTDTQLRATAVPVSLTSTTVTGSVAVTGPLTDTLLRASAVPVSLASLPALASMAAASSTPTGVVSLGNTLGKANVMKTGSLASSAATADQVILTYMVTSGKTFYMEFLEFAGRLTTFATTATLLGTISLESPAGTKLYTTDLVTAGNQNNVLIPFSEPIAIAAGTVVRVVCTPSAVTAFTWKANFGGYEK